MGELNVGKGRCRGTARLPLTPVQAVIELGRPLDGVIANAGIMALPKRTVKHGYELQFLTNHIGHFILVTGLLEQLCEDARVVILSSSAHKSTYKEGLRLDDLAAERGYTPWGAYGQSKLANVLFTREHARRYPEIEAYCLHPGMVRTRIGNKRTNWLVSTVWSLLRPFIRSLDQGAQTSIYLASAENIPAENGQYFDQNQQARRPSELALDDALAQELWERTEQLIDRRKMRDER